MTDAFTTQSAVEAWVASPVAVSDLRATQSAVECWIRPLIVQSDSRATQCAVEVWFAPGPYVPPPEPHIPYCASDPRDATGDHGSPGTGMTDQFGDPIVSNNPPVDASGTYPGSTGTGQTPQVDSGAEGGSTITALFGSQIVCRVKPVDASE